MFDFFFHSPTLHGRENGERSLAASMLWCECPVSFVQSSRENVIGGDNPVQQVYGTDPSIISKNTPLVSMRFHSFKETLQQISPRINPKFCMSTSS